MNKSQTPLSRDDFIDSITDSLRVLRMPFMRENILCRIEENDSGLLNALDVVADIFETEAARRQTLRFKKECAKAMLKYPDASVDETLYQPERNLNLEQLTALLSMKWLDEHRNVIITGMTGAGKTHMACALAVCALHSQNSVRYARASRLLYELSASETAGTINDVLNTWAQCDLLIVDDFGMHSLEVNQCRNLFEIIESRDTLKSTILISQFPVKDLYDKFADATYAEAILDRLLHKAYRLEMNGASMRKRG